LPFAGLVVAVGVGVGDGLTVVEEHFDVNEYVMLDGRVPAASKDQPRL